MARKKARRGWHKYGLLLILLAIILAILIVLVLAETKIITLPWPKGKGVSERFSVSDGCSVIVGKLIHTINTAESCKIRCRAECSARTMDFDASEFHERENECNECACICG